MHRSSQSNSPSVLIYIILGIVIFMGLAVLAILFLLHRRSARNTIPINMLSALQQTRVTDIAKALLDTIPIVKYRDPQEREDVEMDNREPQEEQQDRIQKPDNRENTVCPICTEKFAVGQDTRVFPCCHRFHPGCVDPWILVGSSTCPLCRSDVMQPRNRRLSGTDIRNGNR